MLEKIQNTNSVSLHIRRGDYLQCERFIECSLKHYYDAIDYIEQQTAKKNLTIFCFSDDIQWVKENLKINYETYFVDINKDINSYFDIELMRNCKHNIIANSSFSWWGAWLNENPNKIVIAPTQWYKNEPLYDIIPTEWIKL